MEYGKQAIAPRWCLAPRVSGACAALLGLALAGCGGWSAPVQESTVAPPLDAHAMVEWSDEVPALGTPPLEPPGNHYRWAARFANAGGLDENEAPLVAKGYGIESELPRRRAFIELFLWNSFLAAELVQGEYLLGSAGG